MNFIRDQKGDNEKGNNIFNGNLSGMKNEKGNNTFNGNLSGSK